MSKSKCKPWFLPTNTLPDQGNLGSFSYDPMRAREQHTLYNASAQLFLNLGEDHSFEEYIRWAYNPQFKIVSKNTTQGNTPPLFTKMKNKLIEEMEIFRPV